MPKFKPVVQLHNHSKYSLLDAVPSPEEWLEWCLKTGTPGFAITDHGTAISMFHAIRFPQMIEKYNKENKTNYPKDAVVGIPAVELYVKMSAEDRSHFHITAWAVSNEGYFNLMKLASEAYKDTVSYYGNVKARVTFDMIKQYKAGIKFGTGCIAGPIGKAIMEGNRELAEQRYVMYKELFGDELYVEFHPNDLTHEFDKKTGTFYPMAPTACSCDGNQQKAYNHFLRDMVDKYGGKCIPVTDAHFIMPEDKVLQDCLLKNGNENGWYFHESYHQQEAEQIFNGLKNHLGDWLTEEKFASWIDNTYEVMEAARSINIKFDHHLPKIDIPQDLQDKAPGDYDKQTYFYMMRRIMHHGRWNNDPAYIERFKKELDVIMKNKTLNFIPYFLVYEDLCDYARSQGILQNLGRGSAGGSLISYYLKIIHVDPIKADLPFERFLSHSRINGGSFPDIDCDFGLREPILAYLKQKYGAGFAQIATFQKMKTKNAIKDAMWSVYGRNRKDPEVEAICRTIPDSPQGVDEYDFLYGYTDNEGHEHRGLVDTNEHLRRFFKSYPEIEKMVQKLVGVVRGWGRHASAFVISTTDLSSQRLPTMIMEDEVLGPIQVTQLEASMCEQSGLVKADILGVTTISAVADCVELVKQRTGQDLLEEDSNGVQAIYRLPNEPGVYKDFYDKKTDSSFQFNTALIKGYIQQFNPTEREHLSAMTALCRPGALDAPFTNDEISEEDGVSAAQYYMDVRNGTRPLSYLHPDLATCTSNGVFVYQEEVMKFLVDIAGYSLEQADQIRAAIAKKKLDKIQAAFKQIREQCTIRGWTEQQIEIVCKMIEAFSKYSFNRSHSYCYGELGYITMYLKHFYPLEWWTAVLNNNVGKEDKVRHFMTLLGDMVQPPSLLAPSNKFVIYEDKIVAPLSIVKGVGPASIAELVKKGPFTSLEHYLADIDHRKVNSGHFSNLIKARAADGFMDQNLPYPEARMGLINEYVRLRGCKPLKEELYTSDPLAIFLMERDANTCYNKHVLSEPAIMNRVKNRFPALKATGDSAIPFIMPVDMQSVYIVSSIKSAESMMHNGFAKEIGMFLLYDSSNLKQGVSKKSGKEYKFLTVDLSDGYNAVECTWWRKDRPLKWPKNSIVYVRGELKTGWKTPLCINVLEMVKIDEQ